MIPKMEAVYVPPTLKISPEKLENCVDLKLLSINPLQ